jgi:hypothetical protein
MRKDKNIKIKKDGIKSTEAKRVHFLALSDCRLDTVYVDEYSSIIIL